MTKAHAEETLNVGDLLPTELKAVNQDGQTIDLAQTWKQGLTVVYFYPKANTPGCTAQACSLRDAFAELKEHGIRVLGVSKDSPEAQSKFQDKYNLPFDLIADQKGEVLKAFGVPSKLGFASRQAFLIQDGKLVWKDESASTQKQAEDILKAYKSLKK